MLNRIPLFIKQTILFFVTGLIIFTIFRLTLFIVNFHLLSSVPTEEQLSLVLQAFIMGIRYDIVISGYVLAFPFLIFFFIDSLKMNSPTILRINYYFVSILYLIAFLFCSIDIPFFTYYLTRLNDAVFLWANDFLFSIKMIFQSAKFIVYLVLFIVIVLLFYIAVRRIEKTLAESSANSLPQITFYKKLGYFLVFSFLLFIGIRGRIDEKTPINIGTASFSSYAFINQLGMNPVFSLLISSIDDKTIEETSFNEVSFNEAVKTVKKSLGLQPLNSIPDLQREVSFFTKSNDKNVVLIIMESMSAELSRRFTKTLSLTPFLDSLSRKSFSFDNVYTSGNHTYEGIFSTLFSFPLFAKENLMKYNKPTGIKSLPHILHENGYYNIFFINHDIQFDNINGYLLSNKFDRVIGEQNFPEKWRLSTLGVPDHILFHESVKYLDELNKNGKKFFASFMTASNHDPLIIPENISFYPNTKDKRYQVVEYCDWSLSQFFKEASTKDWFNNTIFVLVADHGLAINYDYEMPLALYHTPLIFYSTETEKNPKIFDKLGSQLDVFPSVMELLNISYVNSSFGINLFREKRDYAIIRDDVNIGCLSRDYLWIRSNSGKEYLYNYRSDDKNNILINKKAEASEMKKYTYSIYKVAKHIFTDKKWINKKG